MNRLLCLLIGHDWWPVSHKLTPAGYFTFRRCDRCGVGRWK